ncbi:acylphosphatase [Alkalimonas sp.]|uniref:acylphosphatase n=1 Tax=Alkalimonas sp. TaxID=1872453 RepID=UPI00263A6D67|nr:acylphosphatase [Alkalimonas sp.]MCC5825120.1 acylphosphatase [Alkalimonas sp.]
MHHERWRLLIHGKVQGVFYRASTQQQAQMLGLTGYCQNLEDGLVQVVAEGMPDHLQQLLEWCWQGPAQAEVSAIDVDKDLPTDEWQDFQIRR